MRALAAVAALLAGADAFDTDLFAAPASGLEAAVAASFRSSDGEGMRGRVVETSPEWFEARSERFKAEDGKIGEELGVVMANFYSGSCGHCQTFAQVFQSVAKSAADAGCPVDVVAVNCDAFRSFCTRFGVESVPKIVGFAKGTDVLNTDAGEVLSEDPDELLAWISETEKVAPIQNRKVEKEADDITPLSVGTGEEFGSSLGSKEMLKRDISSALRFGLETGVFLGRGSLEGAELDALFRWLEVNSQSFPGTTERNKIGRLLAQLKRLAASLRQDQKRNSISSEDFDKVLEKWDFAVFEPNQKQKWGAVWYLCSPRSLKDLGVYGGYPCALWSLFHVLSVSSGHGGASPKKTVHAISDYVRYFFSCNECRENFIASNPDPEHDILRKAESLGVSQDRALVMWLWSEHNAVTRRLNHYILQSENNADAAASPRERSRSRKKFKLRQVFPSPDQCRKCYFSPKSKRLRDRSRTIDAQYLHSQPQSDSPNAEFRVIIGNHADVEEEGGEDWDYEHVYIMLLHSYCFSNDSKLRCVYLPADPDTKAIDRGDALTGMVSLMDNLMVFIFLCIFAVLFSKRHWLMKRSKSH